MLIKALAVFCGSQTGNDERFAAHAAVLGSLIAANGVRLIYGGGNAGLMGVVANAVLANGGEVTGVIPAILEKRERAHKGLSELIIAEDMHSRKKTMYELCDAAIILPGGYGTMDELFEMITWNNLSIHNKPIFLLNTSGYYNALLDHINNMQQAGFLYTDIAATMHVIDDPEEMAMNLLERNKL